MEFLNNWGRLIILLSIATILSFVWLFINKKKLSAKWWELVVVAILHTLVGVCSVRFFAVVEAGFNFKEAGNMSLYGGIFFMPLFYVAYSSIKKVNLDVIFDIFVVSLIGTLMLARFNCIFAGCCGGIILPSGKTVPTRELEISAQLIILILFIFNTFNKKIKGINYSIYMAFYGIIRFVLEFFRVSDSHTVLHIGHIWSIASIVAGVGITTFLYLNYRKAIINEA